MEYHFHSRVAKQSRPNDASLARQRFSIGKGAHGHDGRAASRRSLGQLVVGAALLLGSLAGCGGSAPPPQPTKPPVPTIARVVKEFDDQRIVRLGEDAAVALKGALQEKLLFAMKREGVEGAVTFCHSEALILTDEVQKTLQPGMSIRRTSLRPRNPANAPDPIDTRVLGKVQEDYAAGNSLPQTLVEPVTLEDGPGFRVYSILQTEPLCTACHGNPEQFGQPLRDKLNALYPNDQGTGFQQGEMRGAVCVTIPGKLVKYVPPPDSSQGPGREP